MTSQQIEIAYKNIRYMSLVRVRQLVWPFQHNVNTIKYRFTTPEDINYLLGVF